MKITEKLIKTTDAGNLKMIEFYLVDQYTALWAKSRERSPEVFRYRDNVVSLERRIVAVWDRMKAEGLKSTGTKSVEGWDFSGYFTR